MSRKFYVYGINDYEWGEPKHPTDTSKLGMTVWADDIGDEYHTMHELYQHRMALTIALFHAWAANNDLYRRGKEPYWVGKAKLHHDGTMFEGGYFIVFAQTPAGQISYHYKLKHWDKFQIPEYERVPFEYDGHSSLDVLERLSKL